MSLVALLNKLIPALKADDSYTTRMRYQELREALKQADDFMEDRRKPCIWEVDVGNSENQAFIACCKETVTKDGDEDWYTYCPMCGRRVEVNDV